MVTKACTRSTAPQLPTNLPYYACAVNPYFAPSTFATCCSGPIINTTTLSDLADHASCAAYCPVTDDASNPANPYGFSDFFMCLFSPPSVWGVEIDGYCLPPVNATGRMPSVFSGVGSDIRGGYTSLHGVPTATAAVGGSSVDGSSTTTVDGDSTTGLSASVSGSTSSTTRTTSPATTGSGGVNPSQSAGAATASTTKSTSGGKKPRSNLSFGVLIFIILPLLTVTSS